MAIFNLNIRKLQAPSDEEIVEAEDLRAKLADTHRRRAGEATRRSRSREDPLRTKEDVAEARRLAQEKLKDSTGPSAAGEAPAAPGPFPAEPSGSPEQPPAPSEDVESSEIAATLPSEATATGFAQRKKPKRPPRAGYT